MGIWKIVVIVALLAGLLGYGIYQQQPPPPFKPGPNQPVPTPADDASKKWVGKPAIAWNIPADYWMNTGGAPVQLKDTLGKVTLVEFFRIKCPHCEAAAPEMVQLYNSLKPHGLNMIAIQAPGTAPEENDWPTVQSTAKEWHLPYPIAFDEGSKEFKKYGFTLYPTVLLLDKNGIIRWAQSGYDEEAKKRNLLDAVHKQLGLGSVGGEKPQPVAAHK